jgi:perosamine synthetase
MDDRSALGPYTVPYSRVGTLVDEREIEAVRQVLLSSTSLSQGPLRHRFEDSFRDYVGARHAISVTSGTVALELAIRLLDLRPGDEVITTPQTYQATIEPLLELDVRVRFADISEETANIDPERVAALVTSRTKAIILVHYGGFPADMDPLMRIADEHDIVLIEDAAHGLGSAYRGRRLGSIGHIGCFSFHSTKNITTLGEGGMITLNRDDWADRLRRVRGNQPDMALISSPHRFGSSTAAPPGALYPGEAYTHDCVSIRRAGTNATLSEAAAAVGLVQLDKLPQLVARRQAIAAYLAGELAAFGAVRTPVVPAHAEHAYHLFTFFVDPLWVDRDDLVRRLASQGVEIYLRYFPLHLLPQWRARGHGHGECRVAETLWFSQHMNLPCHPSLSDAQVEALAGALNCALTKVVAPLR